MTWQNRIIGTGEESPDQLLANPGNFRIHPKVQQAALSGSLDTLGWIQQIIVNKQTGHVVDGHLRVSLAIREKQPTVPVVYVDLSPEEEAQALLSLDPIAALAGTDKDKLDALLRQVQTDDANVMQYLTDLAEKNGLEYGDHPQGDAEPEIDRAEELLAKWRVKTGDLWQIGEHRLLCGDSTKREDVERVMGGEMAGAVVTDPPYGINREGIENDDPEGLAQLFSGCLSVMPIENAVVIAFQSPRLFPVWLDAVREAGQSFERALWMYDENDQTKPWHYWLMCSQIAIISTLGSPKWAETKGHHDTYIIGLSREWRAGGDGNNFAHASVKPSGVIQDILGHIGGDVYEPFAGSGTTMVACENLSRKCRAIEISPKYCAVILERMSQAFPGIEIGKLG